MLGQDPCTEYNSCTAVEHVKRESLVLGYCLTCSDATLYVNTPKTGDSHYTSSGATNESYVYAILAIKNCMQIIFLFVP